MSNFLCSLLYVVELYTAGLRPNGNNTTPKSLCRKKLKEYREKWTKLSAPGAVEELELGTLFPPTMLDIPPGAVIVRDVICAWKGSSILFRKIGSTIRRIPDESWTLEDFTFDIDSVTVDPSQDLLVVVELPTPWVCSFYFASTLY